MADNMPWKFVVWERLNKSGKWIPYSAEVSQLIEQSYKKKLENVSLGDADEGLKIYSVNFKDMVQVSKVTGTKSTIRRRLCDNFNTLCNGVTWQWCDGQEQWHSYDIDVNNFIESAYSQGVSGIALKKEFRGYKYEIDFKNMSQINKQSKRKRPIRGKQGITPYPASQAEATTTTDNTKIAQCATAPPLPPAADSAYSDLAKDVPGTDALLSQVNDYMKNVQRTFVLGGSDNAALEDSLSNLSHADNSSLTVQSDQNALTSQSAVITNSSPITAIVNGKPWYDSRPPHTHQSQIKPVPGIDPIENTAPKKSRKKKRVKRAKVTATEASDGDIFIEYTNPVEITSDITEDCIICLEPLSGDSTYDSDSTVVQLKLCRHMFHKPCLSAMYNSGPKDKSIQCPTCKNIYGVKCGIQPPGDMIYHVLPYSLPGYPECDTIRIIYDISSGTQGPEHPNPGKKYTAKGFPRHCYLPDNEMGRKVLRLLVKAWKQRLVFTIGRSSTTGEENTVTWNEIHHKTEFGCNRRGHGFPDPNYFSNVLAELEAHGIKEDEVYLWYPA